MTTAGPAQEHGQYVAVAGVVEQPSVDGRLGHCLTWKVLAAKPSQEASRRHNVAQRWWCDRLTGSSSADP